MKILLLNICLCIGLYSVAQSRNFKTTADLAAYINSNYRDSSEKILQAYGWVTSNIRYDTKNALAMNHGTDARAVIDLAFTRRRGVCENFAAIFSDVCNLMGFHAVTIEGITKQNGKVDRQGHSWSGVKIGNDWYLFDPTWDASGNGNFHYFKQKGVAFIDTHLSFDPLWQMMDHTVTYDEFVSGGYNKRQKEFFNYKDSITQYFTEDTLHRLASKVARMDKAGLTNDVVNLFYRISKGELEGEKQEQQMQWYNEAAKLLNESAGQLNDFIQYRNNRFIPSKPDIEVSKMLDGIDGKISNAFLYLDKVDASDAVLVYGTTPAREQAGKLKASYERQKAFLLKFLATALADRKDVFYQ